MDAELGRWTRRGVGFGVGVILVIALVTSTLAGLKIVAMVLVAILFASALGPVVDGVRTRAPSRPSPACPPRWRPRFQHPARRHPRRAFIAVPIAASAEIVLERLQARAQPVGLEPAAVPAEDAAELPAPASPGKLPSQRAGAIGP